MGMIPLSTTETRVGDVPTRSAVLHGRYCSATARRCPIGTRAKFRFGSTWNCVKQSAVSLLLHGPRCGGEDHAGQNPHRKAVIERGEWGGGYAIPATGKNRPSGYAGVPTTGWRIDRTIGTGTAKVPNTAENAEAARFGINSAIRAGMPGSSTTPLYRVLLGRVHEGFAAPTPTRNSLPARRNPLLSSVTVAWSRRTARSK